MKKFHPQKSCFRKRTRLSKLWLTIMMCALSEIKKQNGRQNEARSAGIFLTRKLRRDSLKEIGQQFQTEKYSTVISAIERMKKQASKDRKLRRGDWIALGDSIKKSQEQT